MSIKNVKSYVYMNKEGELSFNKKKRDECTYVANDMINKHELSGNIGQARQAYNCSQLLSIEQDPKVVIGQSDSNPKSMLLSPLLAFKFSYPKLFEQ